tara:strand:+ start:594 stop:971 length:378 start_codon:yes stop_codon:yes gene_type:complete
MEIALSIILIVLLFFILIGLFNKKKSMTHIDEDKLLKIRDDMNYWYTCMRSYMKTVEEHQKDMMELQLILKKLNGHFIMTNDEVEKHFPAVNNKRYLKPKLTLVKMKKQIDKLTKKEKKNEKPKK